LTGDETGVIFLTAAAVGADGLAAVGLIGETAVAGVTSAKISVTPIGVDGVFGFAAAAVDDEVGLDGVFVGVELIFGLAFVGVDVVVVALTGDGLALATLETIGEIYVMRGRRRRARGEVE